MAETCSCSISATMEVVYGRVTFLLLRILQTQRACHPLRWVWGTGGKIMTG